MKKKPVTFTILKSKKDGQFFCHVKHGTREITFFTENHKNHVDVSEMVKAHVEAILEGRFIVSDALVGQTKCCGGKCSKRKSKYFGTLVTPRDMK